jgi:hypothetical protein
MFQATVGYSTVLVLMKELHVPPTSSKDYDSVLLVLFGPKARPARSPDLTPFDHFLYTGRAQSAAKYHKQENNSSSESWSPLMA